MNRRKVCVVMPSHWAGRLGGAELQVRHLIDVLLRYSDVELSYIARNIAKSPLNTPYSIMAIKPVSAFARFGYWPDSFRLLQLLEQERPDVIYQRVGCAYTGVCAAYARRHKTRFVWHISIDNDLANDIGRFPPISRSIERRIRDYGIRHADRIIAQTDYQASVLYSRFGKKSYVLRNFHDAPTTDPVKRSDFTIVWVANLKPAKRPEAFLDLINEMPTDSGIRYVMVGRGGDKEPYASMIAKASATHAFEYAGEKTLSDVNELIASAHCLVNTSKIEGFPNTFIQAWLRHTIVASMGVDPDGVLSDLGHGVIAEDPQALARTITKLMDDYSMQDRIKKRAYRYAYENHSGANAERLAAIILGC